jgi:hypothetical protein
VLWLRPAVLATQEAKIKRIEVLSQPGQIVFKILSQKQTNKQTKNHRKGLVE